MKYRRNRFALIILALGGLLAGCGTPAAPHTNRPAKGHTSHSSSPSSSISPSTVPNTPSTSGSSPSSVSTSISTSTSTSSASSPPSVNNIPPGAASATELQVKVSHVTAEGTAAINGQKDHIYLVQLSVENPTSGLISVQLNSVTVSPSGKPITYSNNDVITTGLSAQDSLFPFPLTPKSPSATVLNIFPNQTATGDVTVAVAASTSYSVYWGTNNPPAKVATFTG